MLGTGSGAALPYHVHNMPCLARTIVTVRTRYPLRKLPSVRSPHSSSYTNSATFDYIYSSVLIGVVGTSKDRVTTPPGL